MILTLSVLWVSGCKSKDLASLMRLDASQLYLADKYGNKVKVEDGAGFLEVIKGAKATGDIEGVPSETEADYVIISKDEKVYYDADGHHLIYVDKNQKKTVYSGDLSTLISQVSGLPPVVKVRPIRDTEIESWVAELTQTEESAAILFEGSETSSLLVTAGQKPSSGYVLGLEKVSLDSNGVLVLRVRVTAPQGPADAVVTYPSIEMSVEGNPELEVHLVSTAESGEKVEPVRLGRVPKDQRIIALRPERGSLVTEVVQIQGFARLPVDSFSVNVEDGHYVLGTKNAELSRTGGEWRYFDFSMPLSIPSSPNGIVVFGWLDQNNVFQEVAIPVSFGGK